jgi:hypothetical protein
MKFEGGYDIIQTFYITLNWKTIKNDKTIIIK